MSRNPKPRSLTETFAASSAFLRARLSNTAAKGIEGLKDYWVFAPRAVAALKRRGRPEKLPSSWGQKPHLTNNQWLGLEREVRGYQKVANRNKSGWPSTTPAQTIASVAGVSRKSVHLWRKDSQYRRGLYFVMAEKSPECVERMTADDPDFSEFRIKLKVNQTKK